jgi:hypothetical protein
MTFSGLLFSLGCGYILGLFLGPHIRGKLSGWLDVSVACGVSGGLGSAVPYVLLNSIWVQSLVASKYPISEGADLIVWLAQHISVVCSLSCVVAIFIAGLVFHSPLDQRVR